MARGCPNICQRAWSPSASSAIATIMERLFATFDLVASFIPGLEAQKAPCIFVCCIDVSLVTRFVGFYLVIDVKKLGGDFERLSVGKSSFLFWNVKKEQAKGREW